MSTSSLYGTVTKENVSSTNSTSLYGGADTPIPDSSGNVIVRGDLWVLSGNILTTATTGNIFPANATTINLGNAATTINIGADSGTTTINNNLVVDGSVTSDSLTTGPINATTVTGTLFTGTDAEFGNIQIAIATNNTIDTTTGDLYLGSNSNKIGLIGADTLYTDQSTFLLLNSPTTVTAFDSATALEMGATTGITYIRNEVHVGGDLQVNGNDIKSSAGTVAITLSGNDVVIADDFTINGNNLNLAQGTIIGYSEANNRLNRPTVRSTTGNQSGFRVEAPNATTSAIASISAVNTNDANNGKFINISARGALTNDLRIQTGKYTAGVLGPSGSVVSFVDNATAYATVNPAGPTDPLDLTTKAYVDSITPDVPTYDTNVVSVTGGVELDLRAINPPDITIVGATKFLGGTNITISETAPNEITIDGSDLNTTYTIDATSTTGGANLNLVGSDASTDTVAFIGSGGTTVTRTDANTITIDTTTVVPDQIVNGTFAFGIDNVGVLRTTDSLVSTSTTIKGGGFSFGTLVVDGGATTLTMNSPTVLGSDSTVLTATEDSLTWAHTAGGLVVGSVSGTWSLNADGTTSFPNYTFPYADGSADQVLKTDGAGNLAWYSPSDLNTTYTYTASSTTGGANLTLTGSDASVNTVKVSSGTGVTVSEISSTEISVDIGQAVGTSDSVTFADVTLDSIVNLNTATLTTSTTTADQVADSFVAATYRTCKYVIQITSGSAYQAVEALLVHDGSTAYINTYSDIRTGANLTSIGAAVNGSNIELQVTPVNAVTTYKISKTLITV